MDVIFNDDEMEIGSIEQVMCNYDAESSSLKLDIRNKMENSS